MFWQTINLAPYRYAKIHSAHGGPIASISCRESIRLGETVFEAFATLDCEKIDFTVEQNSLYGNSHGSGTSQNRAEAIYRAISEALERWAWLSCHQDSKLLNVTGIHLDPSTSGFAAFPGLVSQSARPAALYEAIERWCIRAWWELKLDHELLSGSLSGPQFLGLEIQSPFPASSVVILWNDSNYGRAYGFAAGATVENAVKKSLIELGRNIQVLEFTHNSQSKPSGSYERRLVYFSKGTGKEAFEHRASSRHSMIGPPPKLIVDRQVPGPWTKYTFVWRCLFESNAPGDRGSEDYFYF